MRLASDGLLLRHLGLTTRELDRYRADDGLLPNRWYYPSIHHQCEFDEILMNDSQTWRLRETMGLNLLQSNELASFSFHPPKHTRRIIVECALLGSPTLKLTFAELCVALRLRFRYFDEENHRTSTWRRVYSRLLNRHFQSVREGGTVYYTLPMDLHLSNRTLCKCGTVHISKETDKLLKTALKIHYEASTPELDVLPRLEDIDEDEEENDEVEYESEERLEEEEEREGIGSASSHFPFVPLTALPKERPRNLQGHRYILLPDPKLLQPAKPPLSSHGITV